MEAAFASRDPLVLLAFLKDTVEVSLDFPLALEILSTFVSDVCEKLGKLVLGDPIAQMFSRENKLSDPKAVQREALGAAGAFPVLAAVLVRHADHSEAAGAVAYAVGCLLNAKGDANVARARATAGLEAALRAARDKFADEDSPRNDVREYAGYALELMAE